MKTNTVLLLKILAIYHSYRYSVFGQKYGFEKILLKPKIKSEPYEASEHIAKGDLQIRAQKPRSCTGK